MLNHKTKMCFRMYIIIQWQTTGVNSTKTCSHILTLPDF